MNKRFEITIDGKKYQAVSGQTVLEIARKNGIDIPSLCYHPDLEASESCRLCLVKNKDTSELLTACSLKVRPGMRIITDSPDIRRARRINLELLFAQHLEECNDCVWSYQCRLLELAKKYDVKINRFIDRKKIILFIKWARLLFLKAPSALIAAIAWKFAANKEWVFLS